MPLFLLEYENDEDDMAIEVNCHRLLKKGLQHLDTLPMKVYVVMMVLFSLCVDSICKIIVERQRGLCWNME